MRCQQVLWWQSATIKITKESGKGPAYLGARLAGQRLQEPRQRRLNLSQVGPPAHHEVKAPRALVPEAGRAVCAGVLGGGVRIDPGAGGLVRGRALQGRVAR